MVHPTLTQRSKAWISLNKKLGFDLENSPVDASHLCDTLTPIELIELKANIDAAIESKLFEATTE
ncbi:hypothetical protein [Acaryochloris sp. CCMEE 5410]|uniref:hypothetical protein n=1 Tax=Acaryochloris sp. CCMEE 5410 TaxID=310037 RepID=UPI0002484791|nr:hypothetical protein [Acaryochloris sp. CCMEE 5410]KAI9130213.1 hypothetical protein ON05_031820 [Acaryochloris sp. CCMEE 5410]